MARISKTQLIKLQKKFKTDAAIGQEFGVTRQAIHQLRKKYGIESSLVSNPQRNEELIQLYKSGTSGTDLAKKFKLSISQAYRIINDSNTPVKKTAKKAAKKAVKKVVKAAAKKVTPPAAKKAVKKVVKAAAKKVTKKAAVATGKKTSKRTSTKVVKTAGKKVAKKK